MSNENIVFIIFFFILFMSFLIIYIKNAILSIISLIIIYCLTSILLMLLGLEFLGIILIIVYVGAIAVLFLYIIIMLDLRDINNDYKMNIKKYINIIFFIFLNIIFILYLLNKNSNFFYYRSLIIYNTNGVDLILNSSSNLYYIGSLLYNEIPEFVLISGILLLLTLLGSIALVIDPNNVNNDKYLIYLNNIKYINIINKKNIFK